VTGQKLAVIRRTHIQNLEERRAKWEQRGPWMATEKTRFVEGEAPTSAGRPCFGQLAPALRRLGRLLERATTAAQAAFGPEAESDP